MSDRTEFEAADPDAFDESDLLVAAPRTSTSRRRIVARIISNEKGARVDDLRERLGVSAMTVRRDLDFLAKRGLVIRVHGGAVLPEHGDPIVPFANTCGDRGPSSLLARSAAEMIFDGEIVVIQGGPIATKFAEVLSARLHVDVTIVTSSLAVASAVAGSESSPQIHLIGGRLDEGRTRPQTFDLSEFGDSATTVVFAPKDRDEQPHNLTGSDHHSAVQPERLARRIAICPPSLLTSNLVDQDLIITLSGGDVATVAELRKAGASIIYVDRFVSVATTSRTVLKAQVSHAAAE